MKALLVAGGSGGHLIPALSLAERLQGAQRFQGQGTCLLLSTNRSIDRTVGKDASVEWLRVGLKPFTPLRQWFFPRYLLNQWRAVRGIFRLVRVHRPQVVVGFGGYLSAVAVVAARLFRIPTVIHEQNVLPGRANRWLAHFANGVAVSFPQTRLYLPTRARVEVTGNPIRSSLKGVSVEKSRAYFQLDGDRPVLLIMGGSQGSQAVNALAVALWEQQSPQDRQKVQVLHLAGEKQAVHVEMAYRRWQMAARVFSYLYDLPLALMASTLSISRAGATTITEMVEYQLPAVLIPYPHGGGHQRANAHWMASVGGAVVFEEKGLTPPILWETVKGLLGDPNRLDRMRTALRAQTNGSAAARLEAFVRRFV